MDQAEGCYRHIKKIFQQLEEFRAFELLRSGRDRAKYLLIKEAKIIAMTCTHAALKRRDLVEATFQVREQKHINTCHYYSAILPFLLRIDLFWPSVD